jgi:hypothetical protein
MEVIHGVEESVGYGRAEQFCIAGREVAAEFQFIVYRVRHQLEDGI